MSSGNKPIVHIRKKITKIYDLISTAYHEAGHTIYALLHLMKVSSVSIFEDKKNKRIHGLTCYDCPGDFNTMENISLLNTLVKSEIGVSYAGLIAEKAFYKGISGSQQTPSFIINGARDDNKSAREMIKKYNLAPPGLKRTEFKKKLSKEVQKELFNYWADVIIVAHALFRYYKLNFQELQMLLTKKSKNKKFWKEQFKRISHYHDNCNVLDEKDLENILSQY